MAKLTNRQYATFDPAVWGSKATVTVGHNRTLSFEQYSTGAILRFKLHGHCVVCFAKEHDGTLKLDMDDCGYPTPTTREAIGDACELFGFRGSVSFAKGGFSPRLNVRHGEVIKPQYIDSSTALYQWKD